MAARGRGGLKKEAYFKFLSPAPPPPRKKSRGSRYLVEGVVEALIEVLQVAEDDSLAQLHGDLDPVDVEADLPVFLAHNSKV